MATIKSYTDTKQSKRLAEILPLESADMYWKNEVSDKYIQCFTPFVIDENGTNVDFDYDIPCWSLAALLNILHSRQDDIPSLSGGGYKDGNYISDWCLDYEYDNGNYQKTFADNPVDACVAMIEKLNELKML